MQRNKNTILALLINFILVLFLVSVPGNSKGGILQQSNPPDSTRQNGTDTSEEYKPDTHPELVPEKDYGYPNDNHPLEILEEPSNIKKDIEMDTGNNYIIQERIGDEATKPPSKMTFEEYSRYKNRQMMENYWRKKSSGKEAKSSTGGNRLIPKIKMSPTLHRIFGGSYVDIQPAGNITLDFGGQWQRVDNPSIPARQQRTGGFNFDQQISMNLTGEIGKKLTLNANWNTQASFDFQNNVKLDYNSFEEDIVQQVEVGNVSLPLENSLISGVQNLFGVKTKLRFGHLYVTSVFASQRGKRETITVEGGGQSREFEMEAAEYEAQRHFFLSHFFRNKFNEAMRNLPSVTSGVNNLRVEVYVTNRNNSTEDLRNFVAFTDLGEGVDSNMVSPGNPNIAPAQGGPSRNDANQLFSNVVNNQNVLNSDNTISALENNFNFQNGRDFQVLKGARKLNDNEYTIHPKLGYISLNSPLQNDEVLAVSYQYTYNGQTYKVGQLKEDYQDQDNNKVIILKMLKPASIKTNLPTWKLMMKNVYSLDASQLNETNFNLQIKYRDDATGIDNPSLHEGENTKDVPLVELLGADRLDRNGNPQPDGSFDYVENVTVMPENGKVVFPRVQPFGNELRSHFEYPEERELIDKYVYNALYDSTQQDARQITEKNKFFLQGRYQSSTSNEISLPGVNIAENSVRVTAGNTPLQEGQDYTVDYNLGRVKIVNEGVLASGQTIKISYEKSDMFNFRQKSLYGARFDYKVGEKLNLGATLLHLNERPLISRVKIGNEPIKNTLWGFDMSFQDESRVLTKAVDKIPLIDTKEKSKVDFRGEFAQLQPGNPRAIGKKGRSYIDDFESTENSYDLTRNPIQWKLGSVPRNENRFPEWDSDSLNYNYRRAKLAWYNVDNIFYRDGANNKPDNITNEDLDNHYIRAVSPKEIFPNRDLNTIASNEPTLDLAYYPSERGPYNYNPDLTPNGRLKNPGDNFAAISRGINFNTNFDEANVQYIEFWMMDPFIEGENGRINGERRNPGQQSGDLFFNLGSVSEDVMPDNNHMFENGLPTSDNSDAVSRTNWGRVPTEQYLPSGFANQEGAREQQDIGLDGLNDNQERNRRSDYLDNIEGTVNNDAYQRIREDPSNDNFEYYLGDDNRSVFERYKDFNDMENNSPVNQGGQPFTPSATNYPDNEDINEDNTLNNLEEYYEYRVHLTPDNLNTDHRYIIDDQTNQVNGDRVTWYQFRVPIREFDNKVGNINGFKTIRFMRMYMTNFENPVILRMAQFQLVASQWRIYRQNLEESDLDVDHEPYNTPFNVSTVNIEENGSGNEKAPGYVVPPGMRRDQDNLSQNSRRLNEQSLQLCTKDLQDKESKAVFKNVSNLDFINYKKLKMFLHAHRNGDPSTNDGDVHAFIRFGTDNEENYYQVEVPLTLTSPSANSKQAVWKSANEIDIKFSKITATKSERNRQNLSPQVPYSRSLSNGYRVTVKGRPDMSSVRTMMIGIKNPESEGKSAESICVWANELRVAEFDRNSGWATTGRLNTKLADLADVTATGTYTTVGYGGLEQKVSERARSDQTQLGVSSNIRLHKFIPKGTGLKLPLYVSYDIATKDPKYDPFNPDVELDEALKAIDDPEKRNRYRRISHARNVRRSINMQNIRKEKTGDGKSHIYDISNLSLSAGYNDQYRRTPRIHKEVHKNYNGAVAYNYSSSPKNIKPFEKAEGMDSPYLKLLKDFNFTPLPNNISVRGELRRNYQMRQRINSNLTTEGIAPIFQKSFIFNRNYGMQWNLTKSISIDYQANTRAVIEEPQGKIDTKEEKQEIWQNIKNLGRMQDYNQQIGINYELPLDKFPLTDWISANIRYQAGYIWTANAQNIVDSLGNTMENNRKQTLNGKLNLNKLYNKVTFLKKINESGNKRKRRRKPENKSPNDTTEDQGPGVGVKVLKTVAQKLMSVKTINFNISLNESTMLPGYMPEPKFAGLGGNLQAPGIPFLLGSQDPEIREEAARNGWLAPSRALNKSFSQSRTLEYSASTQLEPFKDFRLRIRINKNKSSRYRELFIPDSTGSGNYISQNPQRSGSFNMSYMAIRTSFLGNNDENESPVFQKFVENRSEVRRRLYEVDEGNGFYALNSQDVLIPSFLAAYSGKSAENISLSPFPEYPQPNWNIDYSGLQDINFIKENFSSFSITHGYNASYTVNSYTSSLEYQDPSQVNLKNRLENYQKPQKVNPNNDLQYVPVYIINQVTISEQFSPLIGINFRTKSNINGRLEYSKERNVALSMSNAQVTELKSDNFSLGLGYRKSELTLPFKVKGRTVTLDNQISFRVDATLRNTITIQRKIGESNTITSGNMNIQIKPNIDYVVNDRLNLQFYFERTINEPHVSTSFRRTNTNFGIRLRFSLS